MPVIKFIAHDYLFSLKCLASASLRSFVDSHKCLFPLIGSTNVPIIAYQCGARNKLMALVCVLVFDFAIRNSTMTVMTLCCRHLVKINLSYNHIETLAGFQAMRGSDFDLEQIELQGNKLQSISHVGLCLQVCVYVQNASQ